MTRCSRCNTYSWKTGSCLAFPCMHCHTVPVLVDISAVSRQAAWEMGMTSLVDGNCLPKALFAWHPYEPEAHLLLRRVGSLSPTTVLYCTKQTRTAAQRSTSTICSAHKRLTNGCTPRPMTPSMRSSNPLRTHQPVLSVQWPFPGFSLCIMLVSKSLGQCRRLLACQLLGPGSIINLEVLHVQCILNLLAACVHRVAVFVHRLSR